jgi:hypothetical protein
VHSDGEDARARGLAYSRRMSDISELVVAIDGRLADIATEMAALDAAKAELAAPRRSGRASQNATEATATRVRRRATHSRLTPSPKTPEPRIASSESELATAAQDVGSAVAPKRPVKKRSSPARRRRRGNAVGAEMLEELLGNTPTGLSANAIAQQVGAGYQRTLALLHELEAAGQVRRSGSRRSTVWQLITEEEHIARRAAELERQRSAPSQRRGRARAS